MKLAALALLSIAAAACGGGEVSGGVDACMATCLPSLEVRFSGLQPGQVYEISAQTADESISCSVDTSDGLAMDCGSFLFYSDYLDEAFLSFDGNPESVTVTVTLDPEVLVSETLNPEYHSVEICGQTCDVGEVVVAI